jgi:urea carboxylase
VVAVVEAMKAECEIASAVEGVVTAIYAAEGQPVAPGAPLVAVSPR